LSGFQFGAPANLFSRRGRRPIRFSIFIFFEAAATVAAYRYPENGGKIFTHYGVSHGLTVQLRDSSIWHYIDITKESLLSFLFKIE